MRFRIDIKPHELIFRRPAGTSRGVLKTRKIWLLLISDPLNPSVTGIGECGPLPGLSKDDLPDFEARLTKACEQLSENGSMEETDLSALPSVRFAMETALKDLALGGSREIFSNAFHKGELQIPINGLVWMNDAETMYQEAIQKVNAGFDVLKFKVGALDFDNECRLLESIRKKYSAFKVEIRVDANGAFKPDEAMEKLKELSRFELHSIEQPIKPGQSDLMQELCVLSPVKIALDEELIGTKPDQSLLRHIKPHFLILKPSLLGGFETCREWIRLCDQHNTGWWMTSALESNIGLNAIAQFTAEYPLQLPQGLGTGGLYENNFESPLTIRAGKLVWDTHKGWELDSILKEELS